MSSTEITFRFVDANGLNMYIAEAGEGPLVLFLHGFPEFWYSWRKQLPVLAAAGYHVVAPDLRGVGKTDAPLEPEKYNVMEQVGDVIGLMDALEAKKAIIVGHDWGAALAWQVTLLRPDRVRAIAALSVPFTPRNPKTDFLTALKGILGEGFYQNRWQKKETAEDEWMAFGHEDVIKVMFCTDAFKVVTPPGQKMFEQGVHKVPDTLPPFFTEEDVKMYANNLTSTGMTGNFNYYRHTRMSWELTRPWANTTIAPHIPALFMYGSEDIVVKFPGMDKLIPALKNFVPGLVKTSVVEEAHHFVQWEKPEPVNEELLAFFKHVEAEEGKAEGSKL